MLIGITGNIGSGKSTVSKFLSNAGYRVFNADEIGKKVLLKGQKGYNVVLEKFGKQILTEKGEIDTKTCFNRFFRQKEVRSTDLNNPSLDRRGDRINKNGLP